MMRFGAFHGKRDAWYINENRKALRAGVRGGRRGVCPPSTVTIQTAGRRLTGL